jgi:hypothetical protein
LKIEPKKNLKKTDKIEKKTVLSQLFDWKTSGYLVEA